MTGPNISLPLSLGLKISLATALPAPYPRYRHFGRRGKAHGRRPSQADVTDGQRVVLDPLADNAAIVVICLFLRGSRPAVRS
jgi:hypothetical protein